MAERGRRSTWFWLKYVILGLVVAVCALPMAGVIWSSNFAAKHGCTLHEGFQNPCIVDGVDRGADLYTAFVAGWFMLITMPAGAGTLILMAVFAIVDLVAARRARKARETA